MTSVEMRLCVCYAKSIVVKYCSVLSYVKLEHISQAVYTLLSLVLKHAFLSTPTDEFELIPLIF